MSSDLYPFLFDWVYKDYVWGGTRIPELYGRPPCSGLCAESWEISARPEGMSRISAGPLAGLSLADAVSRFGARLLGSSCRSPSFPLLIKLIDARERLSLQVHPDERAAKLTGGDPKTEMWYVLGCAPGAVVFAGLSQPASPERLVEAVRSGRVEPMLRSLPARPGDAIFIPGGRLHAIGAGCLLLEIQQSSNTTYRVYDWERTGRGGPGRQMHLKQALAAIRWDDTALPLLDRRQGRRSKGNACAELCRCDFFVVQRLDLAGPLVTENDGSSFHALFVESGTATLDGGGRAETLAAGRSCLAPAAVTPYTLTPDRAATVIRVSLP